MITILQCVLRRFAQISLAVGTIGVLASVGLSGALAAEKFFTCTPTQVATFTKRIHLACSPADGAIVFFALGVSDQNKANRVLSIASTAVVLKKTIQIVYDPNDLSGENFGCLNKDCRLIIGIQMFQ
jgi:hypothetical protein